MTVAPPSDAYSGEKLNKKVKNAKERFPKREQHLKHITKQQRKGNMSKVFDVNESSVCTISSVENILRDRILTYIST